MDVHQGQQQNPGRQGLAPQGNTSTGMAIGFTAFKLIVANAVLRDMSASLLDVSISDQE